MILCWVAFKTVLGHMWPMSCKLDTPALTLLFSVTLILTPYKFSTKSTLTLTFHGRLVLTLTLVNTLTLSNHHTNPTCNLSTNPYTNLSCNAL